VTRPLRTQHSSQPYDITLLTGTLLCKALDDEVHHPNPNAALHTVAVFRLVYGCCRRYTVGSAGGCSMLQTRRFLREAFGLAGA
jgi:hypothetical protein